MATRVNINPEMLKWARETAHLTLPDAIEKTRTKDLKITRAARRSPHLAS